MMEGFKRIGLEEIKDLAVSDRLETKFLFHKRDLENILSELKQNYLVLEIQGNVNREYRNTYFDTLDYEFYKRHHNGSANRFKVRLRTYLSSGESFLEVKQKKQNGRSLKKRIRLENDTITETQNEFLKKSLSMDPFKLSPSVEISYERFTLVNTALNERITMDTNLVISKSGKNETFGQLVIAELKQSDKSVSLFGELMKKKGIREVAISKYCLSVASLVPGIKRNNFKPLLNTINTKIV